MRSENSGLIDLDALMKEASQPELPRSADDSLEAITTPLPEPPAAAPVAPPPVAVSAPRPSPSPPRRSRPLGWIALASLAGVVALVVILRARHEEVPRRETAVPTPVTAATNASPSPASTGISLTDLPAAAIAAAPTPSATIKNPIAAAPAPSASLVALPDAPATNAGDLGGAMREAVGPRSSADIANAGEPSTAASARQLKPSPGAVVGAIGAVMPAARDCLANDHPVRHATIIFESDGTVARVELAGPAHAADECVRGALSKARTMPFVEDTFAARATVRP